MHFTLSREFIWLCLRWNAFQRLLALWFYVISNIDAIQASGFTHLFPVTNFIVGLLLLKGLFQRDGVETKKPASVAFVLFKGEQHTWNFDFGSKS